MNTAAVKFLYGYNNWANQRILQHAAKLPPAQLRQENGLGWGSFFGALTHIMVAESLWRSRLFDEPELGGYEPEDYADVAALSDRFALEAERMGRCIDAMTEEDFSRVYTRVRDGNRLTVQVWQALLHVVNHGTQHRAECAALLTGFGHSPGELDMTVYISKEKPDKSGQQMNAAAMQMLYGYNEWANALIFAQASRLDEKTLRAENELGWGSMFGTLVHIVDAEYGWRNFIEHEADVKWLEVSDFDSFAAMSERWMTENALTRNFVDSLNDDDMLRPVHFDIEGHKGSHTLWHCLSHVVNHGAQHRAECAALLTDLGLSPGDVDMTKYIRSLED